MRRLSSPALLAIVLLLGASAAHAQEPVIPPIQPEPMSRYVVDVRAAMARLKQDLTVAADLGVEAIELPSRGLGLVAGAHFYPIRRAGFSVGVGGEILRIRGSNTVEAPSEEEEDDEAGEVEDGPTIKTRWDHISPQVSLNFGKRDGWSYVTAGLGRAKLTMERDDAPQEDPASRVRVLNYGGGARWFTKKRVAFTLDLRFYSIDAQAATEGRIATPKMRVMVFSGGISFR